MSDNDAAVDQTLVGIEQEADAVEVVTAVIGSSFRRRFSVQLVLADIAQTFRRRLVVATANAAVTTELFGLTQSVDVENLTPDQVAERIRRQIRVRPGESGINKPRLSRQPPISNAELEMFRTKVYARNVDGLVPPPVVAQRNLTTYHTPKTRPVVIPTPKRGKPQ